MSEESTQPNRTAASTVTGEAPPPSPDIPLQEEARRTEHSVVIDGATIHYTGVAGTLLLRDEKGKAKASIFYVAYLQRDADPATRPITFSFNGGPGSSSVWMHLGMLGPRRVLCGDVNSLQPPPHQLNQQPDSQWLTG